MDGVVVAHQTVIVVLGCQRSPNFPQVGSSKIPHPG
jgi:hypothetical protein